MIFPKNVNRLSFNKSYYTYRSKINLILPRSWLCYSPLLDSVYCEPCWLFAKRTAFRYMIDGYNDWQHISHKITKHEATHIHQESCKIYNNFKNNKGIIDNELVVRQEVNTWRKVLEVLIRIIMMMAKQNMPFRGHREYVKDGLAYGGNFLAIVQLVSHSEQVLKVILQQPTKATKYLSPMIHNELIGLLASKVKESLLDEIRNAAFFSILLDTAPDVSKREQLSICFRYVKFLVDSEGKPIDIKLKESFIEFRPLSNTTAIGFKDEVEIFLKENNIDFRLCRGQAYDGCSTMKGAYNGLQALFLKENEYASYVHCASHSLNLVLNDAVQGVLEAKEFFETLGALCIFSFKSKKMASSTSN